MYGNPEQSWHFTQLLIEHVLQLLTVGALCAHPPRVSGKPHQFMVPLPESFVHAWPHISLCR
jgi:hypothetical protein